MLLIKKYANRRMYDTETRTYINSENIIQYAKNGVRFQIIDAQNNDITSSVLLNVLAEYNANLLPQEMLQKLITFEDDLLNDVLAQYFLQTMNLFLKNQEFFRQQMLDFEGSSPFETIDKLIQTQTNYLENL